MKKKTVFAIIGWAIGGAIGAAIFSTIIRYTTTGTIEFAIRAAIGGVILGAIGGFCISLRAVTDDLLNGLVVAFVVTQCSLIGGLIFGLFGGLFFYTFGAIICVIIGTAICIRIWGFRTVLKRSEDIFFYIFVAIWRTFFGAISGAIWGIILGAIGTTIWSISGLVIESIWVAALLCAIFGAILGVTTSALLNFRLGSWIVILGAIGGLVVGAIENTTGNAIIIFIMSAIGSTTEFAINVLLSVIRRAIESSIEFFAILSAIVGVIAGAIGGILGHNWGAIWGAILGALLGVSIGGFFGGIFGAILGFTLGIIWGVIWFKFLDVIKHTYKTLANKIKDYSTKQQVSLAVGVKYKLKSVNKDVAWGSLKPAVVSVSKYGVITGISPGTAEITDGLNTYFVKVTSKLRIIKWTILLVIVICLLIIVMYSRGYLKA